MEAHALLGADEPEPVLVERSAGASPFLLACDHAGRRIPRRLDGLGLEPAEVDRHIGWDIGALAVSRRLSAKLDAALVAQRYSRLVIDCNRRPGLESSMPEISDGTTVPGNARLDEADRAARVSALFEPYHQALTGLIDERQARGRAPVLIAMHSFTPRLRHAGVQRPWDIGILFNRDERLGRSLIEMLEADGGLCVGENEPYAVSDATDYTVPVHGEARGLVHVEIEIRQDLIGDPVGQEAWAARLARLLPEAVAAIDGVGEA